VVQDSERAPSEADAAECQAAALEFEPLLEEQEATAQANSQEQQPPEAAERVQEGDGWLLVHRRIPKNDATVRQSLKDLQRSSRSFDQSTVELVRDVLKLEDCDGESLDGSTSSSGESDDKSDSDESCISHGEDSDTQDSADERDFVGGGEEPGASSGAGEGPAHNGYIQAMVTMGVMTAAEVRESDGHEDWVVSDPQRDYASLFQRRYCRASR
jgi:hypothetical protein